MKYIGEKTSLTQGALARVTPNIGGPFRRRIISAVVTSIMLYACPIWSEALSLGTTRRILSSVYCLSAIRLISGFSIQTVFDEAVLVLAKTIPIDILADEMRRTYFRRLDYPGQIAAIKAEKRKTSMHKWQSRWERAV